MFNQRSGTKRTKGHRGQPRPKINSTSSVSAGAKKGGTGGWEMENCWGNGGKSQAEVMEKGMLACKIERLEGQEWSMRNVGRQTRIQMHLGIQQQ